MAILVNHRVLHCCYPKTSAPCRKNACTFGRKFNRSKKENKMNKKIILMVIGMVLSLVLTACSSAPSAESNFPTGKFVLPGTDESEGIYFNNDGTFTAFYYGADVA